jgi:uncharacterized membrane protein YdbT with pleckstrin-like domain
MHGPYQLLDGEDLVLDRRPHPLYFAAPAAWCAGFLFAFAVAAWVGGFAQRAFNWVSLPGVCIMVAWVAWRLVNWRFTHFVVTTRRVIWRTGVIARTGVEIPLDRINNVNFSQSVIERLFGAGDLVIESAGRDGRSKFSDIAHPDNVQLLIHRNLDAARRNSPSNELVSQLERLQALRAAGGLTDDEFDTAKAKLLGS